MWSLGLITSITLIHAKDLRQLIVWCYVKNQNDILIGGSIDFNHELKYVYTFNLFFYFYSFHLLCHVMLKKNSHLRR